MMEESSFGSSEYSPEAEDLFAQYLLARDVGEELDFEAFAAEHEEFTEELYGLHTDWDNVRGLLGRLERRREAAPTPAVAQSEPVVAAAADQVEPTVAAAEEVEPEPPTPLAEEADEQQSESSPEDTQAAESREFEAFGSASAGPSRRPLHAALGLLVAVLLVVGYVAVDFYRASEVLAREAEQLTLERTQTEALLDGERQEHRQLQGEHALLTADLAGEREVLAQRERELREEQEAARALQAEKESALSELDLEEQRAEVLARSVRCEVLRSAPLLHSSTLRDEASALATWQAEARALLDGREELQARHDELARRSGPVRLQPLVSDLEGLLASLAELEPVVSRAEAELELLSRVQDELDRRPAAAKPAGLPRGVVLTMVEDASGRLRLGYQDLTVEFAGAELERVPGKELLLLPRWEGASLQADSARLAARLGYRQLSRLESELLSFEAGLRADSRRSGAPVWALGGW